MPGGWFCCCPTGCPEFADDFTGTDKAELSSAWEVVQGTAVIEENSAKLSSMTIAIVKLANFNPPKNYAVVTGHLKISKEAVGQEYRVIAGYKDPETTCYYAYVILDGLTANYRFGIGTMINGTGTSIIERSDSIGTTAASITICLSKTILKASFDGYGFCIYTDGVEFPEGGRVGMANNQDGVWFDGFDATGQFEGNEECPACTCLCLDAEGKKHTVPKYLTATITLESGPALCSCLEQSVQLEYDNVCNGWVSTTPYAGLCMFDPAVCYGPSDGVPYASDLALGCGGIYNGFADYQFSGMPPIPPVNGGVFITTKSPEGGGTCSPFHLEFLYSDWPTQCGCYSPVNKTIRVTITE